MIDTLKAAHNELRYIRAALNGQKDWENVPSAQHHCRKALALLEAAIAEQETPPAPAEGNTLALKRHKSGVWMVRRKPLQSAAREIAEVCLRAIKIDPSDFRKRDEITSAIAPVIGAMLDDVHRSGKEGI